MAVIHSLIQIINCLSYHVLKCIEKWLIFNMDKFSQLLLEMLKNSRQRQVKWVEKRHILELQKHITKSIHQYITWHDNGVTALKLTTPGVGTGVGI